MNCFISSVTEPASVMRQKVTPSTTIWYPTFSKLSCGTMKGVIVKSPSVNVLFGSTDITLDEFLDLKEGDIIKLDTKSTDDLIVKVNGEKKYFARPGTLQDKASVKITEEYDNQKFLLNHYYYLI